MSHWVCDFFVEFQINFDVTQMSKSIHDWLKAKSKITKQQTETKNPHKCLIFWFSSVSLRGWLGRHPDGEGDEKGEQHCCWRHAAQMQHDAEAAHSCQVGADSAEHDLPNRCAELKDRVSKSDIETLLLQSRLGFFFFGPWMYSRWSYWPPKWHFSPQQIKARGPDRTLVTCDRLWNQKDSWV